MSQHLLAIALPLVLLYVAFWLWYGGNGQRMSPEEIEEALNQLRSSDLGHDNAAEVEEVRQLLASDDGKEFVMQNLVRYRAKALYPEGTNYSDDPREADKRYGKSIIGDLLRYGNVVIFIARKSGDFVRPEGADAWHYVAMVRYRSRRDFVRFAIRANQADKFMHKWAAIEKTHVFPVKPLISLFAVRTLVALSLFTIGVILTRLL
ncbi:hypothetical protein [Limnohabitans sp. Hippo4]|jgi:hypothetical protein|uniref:hypothetical protein n=1 Tax=Limnohabitans sp. Hippo4 TaxID=1826167 RepID=UPI000D33AE11|nr:hypothetical protein [Limnohabitans sp. Hippo4]MBU3722422.1 hypothetical protein [Limnohabitans sp.]PUE37508.1 hypothetical protein B9Z46_01985 [Limnohabitans sp. Hippo4]